MALKFSNSLAYAFAVVLLGAMFFLAFFSMQRDALTFDELAHIPAGYSYLTQQDYRINPEHPPLAKDIAAFPLLFLNLNFPTENENWTQDAQAPPWWVQFNLGSAFLYQSGNDPLSMIFWSRLPMIALTLVLGGFLFFWTRKLLGNAAALAVLALFAFSPSFLAHGRLVTTDVASALGMLVAIYFWIAFLKQPSKGTVVKAGAALAFAFFVKFSAVLLIPFFAVLAIAYALLYPHSSGRIATAAKYAGLSFIAGVIALAFILPVYQLHILNYPAERQVRDTIADMQPGGVKFYEQAIIAVADKPGLRAFAQFGRGILMATQRGQFGNTVFFRGDIKAGGFWQYFPLLYLFKIPLAFHLLSLVGIAGVVWAARKQWYRGPKEVLATWCMKKHFTFFAFALFVAGYLLVALLGNLNIGVRHLFPIIPLLYMLTAWGVQELLSRLQSQRVKKFILALVGGLFAWYIGSSLAAFPHYIPYYNQLAGGTEKGYQVAVDSNYDWGQDFYRLLAFVEANNIQKIHMDYFGGENPEFYLGDTYEKLDPFAPPAEGWVAVSVNQLMGGTAAPVAGFDQPTGYYTWLLDYEPVERAGNSIFIYKLP